MSSTRDALEAAIRANPDDIAAHSALADLLIEQEDPLGDFMRVQMALEDPKLTGAERKKLRARETNLLKKYEQEWVGPWKDLFPEPTETEGRCQINHTGGKKYEFCRGLLTTANFGSMNAKAVEAFVKDERTRFVRELFIGEYDGKLEDGTYDNEPSLTCTSILMNWPYLNHVRRFQLGFAADEVYRDEDGRCWFQTHTNGDGMTEPILAMKKLEELYIFAHHSESETEDVCDTTFSQLRILQLYHGSSFPLKIIAKNKSFQNLTHLLCHPSAAGHGGEAKIDLAGLKAVCRSKTVPSLQHLRLRLADFGDDGAHVLATSGILKRLKTLDLRHGCITDAGVEMLVESPDFQNLEFIDIYHNAITNEGEALLKRTKVKFDARRQHSLDDEYDTYGGYLSEGDYE